MVIEHTVRICAVAATVTGVPVLLAIAIRKWICSGRSQLSTWRNALGLAALLFVMSGWLWYVLIIKGVPIVGSGTLLVDLWSFETSIGTLLAPFLSFAWKNAPRYYLLASTLLLIVGGMGFYYS